VAGVENENFIFLDSDALIFLLEVNFSNTYRGHELNWTEEMQQGYTLQYLYNFYSTFSPHWYHATIWFVLSGHMQYKT
jgi:hypothetical protein